MTAEMILLMLLLGIAMLLFWLEVVPVDVVALSMLLILAITGLIPADRAFMGFGSDTVMMMLGLLILTASLLRTGWIEQMGTLLLRRVGQSPLRILGSVMALSTALSALISNTATTALLIPMTSHLARNGKISASKILLPVAFAAILASSITLISSSTNIVVSGMITQYGLEPIGILELSPVGIPIAAAGLLYMLLLGHRLIPDQTPMGEATKDFGLNSYFSELEVTTDSPLAGKTLGESRLGHDLDLTVVRIIRNSDRPFVPQADTRLMAGDILLVEGSHREILRLKETGGISIRPEVVVGDPDLQTAEMQLVEAILPPGSPFLWRTLEGLHLRERFRIQVLAVSRHGGVLKQGMARVRLRFGDVLLLQAPPQNLAELEADGSLQIVGSVNAPRRTNRRTGLAILIFVGALAAAGFGLVSLPVAVLSGAALAFLTRCITPEEAYREVEWKAIIFLGSILGIGVAMEHTGTARFLAGQVVQLARNVPPLWLLSSFFLLTMLLTQPMSNQAAAVVILPVAVQTALQLGLNPRTFAMMVAVGASCSFITPLEPACLLVYGPGRYRFSDFVRVGTPLTIIIFLIAILLVPVVWPLVP